jgi:16S rRNA (guanine(966)-N(2))-methyltransferase RsmD
LYAGTGSLGLEALSRGARRVVFVECDRAAIDVLRRNIAHLGVAGEAEVVAADALRYLAKPHEPAFDLVLADPPYAAGAEARILEHAARVLVPGGVLVLQHGAAWTSPDAVSGWERWRPRRFGDTVIDFFARRETGDGGTDGAVSGDL